MNNKSLCFHKDTFLTCTVCCSVWPRGCGSNGVQGGIGRSNGVHGGIGRSNGVQGGIGTSNGVQGDIGRSNGVQGGIGTSNGVQGGIGTSSGVHGGVGYSTVLRSLLFPHPPSLFVLHFLCLPPSVSVLPPFLSSLSIQRNWCSICHTHCLCLCVCLSYCFCV
uniref:Uncharacterized protein n=1 Tax=Esox lucius TaxID=8010 RepID=A0AAY5KUU6_ESOLU